VRDTSQGSTIRAAGVVGGGAGQLLCMTMNRASIAIPPRVVAALRRHAAIAIPGESCGALVGLSTAGLIEVRAAVPVPNASAERSRYAIDAHTVRELDRQASCAGLQLVGFYHSHPQSPAIPSDSDLELAWPGYIYVIVDAAACTVRAWRLHDDRSAFYELSQSPIAGAA
jgi:proteasome lid subunit RPN8/RPN11